MHGHGNLRRACRDSGIPHSTFLGWIAADKELADQYARAKEIGIEQLADEILEIADDGTGDTWKNEDGLEMVNHDVIARSRLRVDTRKWLLSKILHKKYGDKLDLTSGDKPLPSVTINVPPLPDGGPEH